MASLRKRIFGGSAPSPTVEKAEEVRLAPVSKIVSDDTEEKVSKNHKKRRNGLVFTLGGLFGVLLAGMVANKNDLIELPEMRDFSLDSLVDVLPAGFMREARELSVKYSTLMKGLSTKTSEPERRTRSGEL